MCDKFVTSSIVYDDCISFLCEKCGNECFESFQNIIPCDQLQFGSLLDWVPFYKDKEYNLILRNCNPDSDYFDKTCLAMLERDGYMYYTFDITIERLISEFIDLDVEEWETKNISFYMLKKFDVKNRFSI